MPLVTDLALYRMPEAYQLTRALVWKAQYRLMKKHVVRWLAISEFTKRDMVELLGISAQDIDVVYTASHEDFCRVSDGRTQAAVREKYALPERYILFVGNFNPRKNLSRLIRAFDAFKRRSGLPHKLVIAGEHGWKFDKEEALSDIGHMADILFLGFVADADMPALYSMAELFAFPTLYEGFGIPVIEAQRCGTPVLTSNVSALPEVAGDGAFYVDPYDIDAISAALESILSDDALARELAAKGTINAKRFSWQTSARQLNDIIESVINDGNNGTL
jgi:glycosyltransferase involved in cell wall biosynthesis